MPFCMNCGAKMPDGATFCPSCGAPQQVQRVATAQTKGHRELSTVLVLIGGVLGLVFALASLLVIPLFAHIMILGQPMMTQYGGFGMMGYPRFGVLFGGLMLLWSGVGLVGALLAVFSGLKLRRDDAKGPAMIGIVGGVLLLVTFSWIPGLMVLAGSILAYIE